MRAGWSLRDGWVLLFHRWEKWFGNVPGLLVNFRQDQLIPKATELSAISSWHNSIIRLTLNRTVCSFFVLFFCSSNGNKELTSVAQLVGHLPAKWKVMGLILVRAHAWVVGLVPAWGVSGQCATDRSSSHLSMLLSRSFSFPSPISQSTKRRRRRRTGPSFSFFHFLYYLSSGYSIKIWLSSVMGYSWTWSNGLGYVWTFLWGSCIYRSRNSRL